MIRSAHALLGGVLMAIVAGCAPKGIQTPAPSVTRSDTAATSSVVIGVEPWDQLPGTEGVLVRTNAYRLFISARDARLVEQLPAFCEAALTRYRTALGDLPPPPAKLDTYLVDNRSQWVTLTTIATRERAEDYLQIRRGGFATRGAGYFWDIGFADTLSLTAHEGWHQYTQRTFRNRLPPWLEEGIASYHEGIRLARPIPTFRPWSNTERFDRLRDLVTDGRLLPLSEVVRLSPGELIAINEDRALDWYAQVWAAVHFLREGEGGRHARALEDLLQHAAKGDLWRRVSRQFGRAGTRAALRANGAGILLQTYTQTPRDELDDAYARFVHAIVRPGARQIILAGGSPVPPGV